ncbi:hypothetical protein HaLaN_11415 [Haematococcus lacustris]|uniref:Uncharacterized protein n=1 Tax=Haematococcus lacustris TaxID=44745 RepID=A0A699YY62_HAELA|nr:hypothetical protein HaLaN_11415 [Haematococcus lacustris]
MAAKLKQSLHTSILQPIDEAVRRSKAGTLWGGVPDTEGDADPHERELDSDDDEQLRVIAQRLEHLVLHLVAFGFVDLLRIGSHQTCITSMFEPGAVTKYVPIGPLGPFFRVSPNQHITNRAYQYGIHICPLPCPITFA